jgi:hypothetical protein
MDAGNNHAAGSAAALLPLSLLLLTALCCLEFREAPRKPIWLPVWAEEGRGETRKQWAEMVNVAIAHTMGSSTETMAAEWKVVKKRKRSASLKGEF